MDRIPLSICIPTFDRWEILDNTLESIYSQSDNLLDQFEIIITNNNTQLKTLPQTIVNYSSFNNLFYYQTKVKGFQNTTESLRLAKGNFLKLSNDYTKFRAGTLQELIEIAKNKKYIADKPFIFFRNSNQYSMKVFPTIDEMIFDNTYLITWSTGYSFWRDDLYNIDRLKLNKYFPHLTLLEHKQPSYSVVIDKNLFDHQEPKKKGGYNIFYVFGNIFLEMMYKEFLIKSRVISIRTFKKIKSELLKSFLSDWSINLILYPQKYSFERKNVSQNLRTYYGRYNLIKLLVSIFVRVISKSLKKLSIWKNRKSKS